MKSSTFFSCLVALSCPLWLAACGSEDEYADDEPKKKKKKKERPAPQPPVLVAGTPVLISEIVSHSSHSFEDSDGDRSDWIELFNSGSEPVDLAGFALTDDEDDLAKWTLPEHTLDPGAFLTVFASGKDRKEAGGELHTNFKLDGDGEFLALVGADDQGPIHTFGPVFPEIPKGQSYGYEFAEDGAVTDVVRMFKSPTPGRANADEAEAPPETAEEGATSGEPEPDPGASDN